MQRIEIVALLSDSKKIIERLQRRGIVELCNISEERLVNINTSASISQFEKAQQSAMNALSFLDAYAPKKTSLLDSFSGKRIVDKHDFGSKAALLEPVMNTVYNIISYNKEIENFKNDISRARVSIDSLTCWKALDIPLNFTGTQKTSCFIGTLPGFYDSATLPTLFNSEKIKNGVETEVVSAFKDSTNLTVLCHNDDKEEVLNILKDLTFTSVSEPCSITAAEKIAELYSKIDNSEKSISTLTGKIVALANNRSDIEFAIDYFGMRKDKYEALQKLGMTEHTFVLQGFIPQKYADKLVLELEGKYNLAISITEPHEDDDVPVLLQNSKFSEPVEGITEMYALPNRHDVDPTSIMSFFYYLFFGMMLSDAGYGVLMVIGTAIALKKINFEDKMRKTLKMFQYCGISTIFWGALFGSWFGDIVPVVANQFFGKNLTSASMALWFNPIDDPMRLLLFSFVLGIAHLFLGLGVNFYILWRDGKKWDAIFDVIPVMLTILGVAPLAGNILSPMPAIACDIGKYFAIIGVAAIILTAGRSSKNIFMRFFGGIYGLYNIATGYLSDILSYSRLLALGLATGQIASVINLIGTMPENPVLKLILLVVVFFVGHIANLAINLLGAYVHTDRLQFVELFSKFYEGGGRAFAPLSVQTKYIKFKEE